MLFCTIEYVAFLALAVAVYWLLPSTKLRIWWLLALSSAFYASWNPKLAALVTATTAADFWLAKRIEACEVRRRRKALLCLSLAMNLGLLAYFKYANFFLDSLREMLAGFGVTAGVPTLEIILPIGISFYTFEAINYMVDVYRGKIPAERDLPNFMVFILFFPHLIAGPIVRARDFLPQLRRHQEWSWFRASLGVWLIALGWAKKALVADRMGLAVDPVFADPGQFGCLALWMAAFGFVAQVYCDFSGYTDMAVGSALIMGYRLAINFRLPLLAPNLGEFWRRWHISLSSWLRDYVFIPLGGSRGGEYRTCRNLIITMVVGGFWHGAGWNFIAWGFLQGWLLTGHRFWARIVPPASALGSMLLTRLGTALRICCTLMVFALSLVVFRVPSVPEAGRTIGRMFADSDGRGSPLAAETWLFAAGLLVAGHAWVVLMPSWGTLLRKTPAWLQGLGLAALLGSAIVLAPGVSRAFIYFQF